MAELVLTERRENGVWIVTLNDPERRNAIGPEMQQQLVAQINEVAADPEGRAMVVRGAGTTFCAGADLPAIFGGTDRAVDNIRHDLAQYYQCFLSLRTLPFPAIAAIHGPAIGAGLNLALCSDIRFASPKAGFGVTFSSIGLHPGGGCTFFLVQAMGAQRALRILLQGETLDAETAFANRLVDEIVDDPCEKAIQLANHIATLRPELARDIKKAVRIATHQGFEPTLEFETWAQASSATKPEIQKVLTRFRARG